MLFQMAVSQKNSHLYVLHSMQLDGLIFALLAFSDGAEFTVQGHFLFVQ
jgi:hypothetical protein